MKFKTYEEASLNDPTICRCIDAGLPMEKMVLMLANEKGTLIDEIMKLTSIAPRKYQMPDGQVLIWRCPDELVPMTILGDWSKV